MEAPEQSQILPEAKKESNLGLKGIVEVFYKPAKFFERLKDDPKILVPWIFFFLFIFTFLFLVSDLILENEMKQIQDKIADGEMDASQVPSKQTLKLLILSFGTIALMLAPLIAAGLALFIGNVVMEGRAKFKPLLSVMIYGEIINALGALILAPLMLAKGSMKVSISLAAILQDSQVQDPLYIALSKFGAFYIWEIIVIGIGLSIIYGFSRNKGYTLAVLSMGLISITHALMELAFG